MKNQSIVHTLIIGGAAIFGSSNAKGQTLEAEYITEWQTDFRGGYDWLNLLVTTAELPLSSTLSVEASTISTAKTGESTLIDDLLTYSNIEAGNIPLTFARLGVGLTVKNAQLFVGINNVNQDYFTTDKTAFFTNSSFGIVPTISCNYDIANYPLASWCIHYRQTLNEVALQTSLYTGQGYHRLGGHDNLFELNIDRDGIFSITSLDYRRNDNYYSMGIALHWGMCLCDSCGESPEAMSTISTKKRFAATPWLMSEIALPHSLGLVAHASYSSVKHGCKGYGGLGLIYHGKRIEPGVALNYAKFSDTSEFSVELTSRIPLQGDKITLQPALHLCSTDGDALQCVGMMRLNVSI